MIWQEIVLTLGSLIFIIALLPSIYEDNKPAASTSIITGVVLVAFSIVYITLDLVYPAITSLFTAVMWFILLVQVKLNDKKNRNKLQRVLRDNDTNT
jgi:hypothetical protein